MAVKGKGANAPKQTGGGGQNFDDTNRGVLFANDKDGNEARPDYTGNLAIDPDVFERGDDGLIRLRLAGWLKNSPKAGDYISISASPPKQG